jgi:uncharacterized protein YceK
MNTTVVLIAICVLIYGSSLIYAEELANSGYPVNKANIERNNQINRAVSNPILMHLKEKSVNILLILAVIVSCDLTRKNNSIH